MNFTAEELRRLWLNLYRDEVSRLASKGVDRDSLHDRASAHADRHVRRLSESTGAGGDIVAELGLRPPARVILDGSHAKQPRGDVGPNITSCDGSAPVTGEPRGDSIVFTGIERAKALKNKDRAHDRASEYAEMERVRVESLKEGDRVLLLGTVNDITEGSDWDAACALVRLDGDEMGDGSTTLRAENVVYRAPAQMGNQP